MEGMFGGKSLFRISFMGESSGTIASFLKTDRRNGTASSALYHLVEDKEGGVESFPSGLLQKLGLRLLKANPYFSAFGREGG